MDSIHSAKRTKVVYAPLPSSSDMFSSIYSIEITEDEEVEWQWLTLPDGSRVVTDYKIIYRQRN